MNGYRYLFNKNIEINYAPNDTSINYKDNTNMTSLNPVTKNKKELNYFFPSYNTRQFKEEKNINKITKLNSKYSTCYNYYPRKNYSKYLNYKQSSNSSSVNKNINNQQNTTFDDFGGYNKLQTKDLIEITKKRQEIINQQKIKEQEKKKFLENNLENLDIILNDNSPEKNKKYCDEGVQTSLVNNNQLDNKKEDPVSTIIFTDKSALINQEITFLSIQYSVNQNNNKENINNNSNSESSKDYKNTENNDFVNVDFENKDTINMSEIKDKEKNYNEINNNNSDTKEINGNDIKNINEEQKKDDNFQNDLEFTIVNNTQTSQNAENEDNNYMTNGPETFQIEFNEQNINNNSGDENFIINNNTNKAPKIFNDSLEDSEDIDNRNNIDINKSKSLLNTEENEVTEVEEFDQNLIILQNQSKTMSSHFDNISNKSSDEKEENKISNNNNNIFIQDISNNENEAEINLDSLNDSLSLKKKIENNNNNITENIFRNKGKKNNSLNKYQDYPHLRNLNLNDNNSLCSKIYNRNNLTNNDRYQNNKNRLEKENECLDLLKLKKSDIASNDKEKFVMIKPFKNPEFNSKEYDSTPNITSYNKSKSSLQNIKVFSQKKLNITTNENSKINISGIPICPNQSKNNINIQNYKNKNNINKNVQIPNEKNNYLITPRFLKKKRHINNYADYYKLKISMSKDISNINTNNINNNIS